MGGAVVEDVVELEVISNADGALRHKFHERVGGDMDEGRRRRTQCFGNALMILIPGHPFFPGGMIRLAEGRAAANCTDKGTRDIINVAGDPERTAVAMYNDRLALPNALQIAAARSDWVEDATTFAVGVGRTNNRDSEFS